MKARASSSFTTDLDLNFRARGEEAIDPVDSFEALTELAVLREGDRSVRPADRGLEGVIWGESLVKKAVEGESIGSLGKPEIFGVEGVVVVVVVEADRERKVESKLTAADWELDGSAFSTGDSNGAGETVVEALRDSFEGVREAEGSISSSRPPFLPTFTLDTSERPIKPRPMPSFVLRPLDKPARPVKSIEVSFMRDVRKTEWSSFRRDRHSKHQEVVLQWLALKEKVRKPPTGLDFDPAHGVGAFSIPLVPRIQRTPDA